MLSKQLESTLQLAAEIASSSKHKYTTIEHLLLALLDDVDVLQVLNTQRVDIIDMRKSLRYHITHDLEVLKGGSDSDPRPTTGFQRVIQRAVVYGGAIGINNITGVHLLAEMFFEHESYAVTCLKEHNLTRMDVITSLAPQSMAFAEPSVQQAYYYEENNPTALYDIDMNIVRENNVDTGKAPTNPDLQTAISAYCINLNNKARVGAIDALVGREQEVQRTIEILCRRQKNNPILVGESGVGKTAIAEGLALRVVNNDVPEILQNSTIYALDFGSMVAGARYRGDFEGRMKALIQELTEQPSAILFIDEIHTMVGAGASAGSTLDASNLLKPALARGELRCIGSTTFKEYKHYFAKDAALVRRFQKIVIDEPDEESSFKILLGLKSYYEKHHNVTYDTTSLKAAVYLSKRYITDRLLPDKAIDLMDEAGSRKKISKSRDNIVTEHDIELIVSSIAHLPNVMVASGEAKQIRALERDLKTVIFGQDTAIGELCASIKLSSAGLRNHDRPTGCYLFAGPTGVGKTELARQLAKFCNMKLIRFDMSEYTEPHTASRLIGTPPGYVGFDQGGLLTEAIERSPYSVVLFDKIEKANHEIFNLLLQVMDCGKLTDSSGRTVNFTNSIIVMTSNSVLDENFKARIGFGSEVQPDKAQSAQIIARTFSLEFRSRLDNIIIFNHLDNNVISMIVEKELRELASQLAEKGVVIIVDQSVKSHLSRNVFDCSNGARGIGRMCDVELKQKIADEVLFGKLIEGGSVHIKYAKNRIQFEFDSKPTPSPAS
jgi:ATP-dependent Clp protease ATP-binding subunit ClpA